jgi:hypothetical protein
MNNTLAILLLVFTLNSCGQSIQEDFPNNISNLKSEKHVRIRGTKIYAIVPADFEYFPEFSRYQKDVNLYIQFNENDALSFAEFKKHLLKESHGIKSAEYDINKNIRFNNFDALYTEGLSEYPGITRISLYFGDDSFQATIFGFCKTTDIEGKKEVQKILSTVYYDKTEDVDPLETINFKIDLSITDFKYSMSATNMFTYSQYGKDDIHNSQANSFYILVQANMTDGDALSLANQLLTGAETEGIVFDSKKINKEKINEYSAYTLETKFKQQNKPGMIYQAILIGKYSSLAFLGIAYDNLGDYMKKFKETVKTIKIEELPPTKAITNGGF